MTVRAVEQRRIGIHGTPVREWFRPEVERAVRRRVLVDRPQHELAEAAVDKPRSKRIGGVDVDERAGVDRRSGDRVMVGGALGLDDELSDQAVAPVVDAVHVVVPEDVVQDDVREPGLLDELGADPLVRSVGVVQGLVERQGGPGDPGDLAHLEVLVAEPDADPHSHPELTEIGEVVGQRAREFDLDLAPGRARRQLRVVDLVRPDGLTVDHPGRGAVRAVGVELHVVDVQVRHRERLVGIARVLFRRQGQVDAIADVRPDRERLRGHPAVANLVLVLGEDEELAEVVGRTLGRDLELLVDRHDVEVTRVGIRVLRAEPVVATRPRVDSADLRLVLLFAEPR